MASYTGYSSVMIVYNETIPADTSTVYLTLPGMATKSITWDQSAIPVALQNASLSSLANIKGIKYQLDTYVIINGERGFDLRSAVFTDVNIKDTIGTQFASRVIASHPISNPLSGIAVWNYGMPIVPGAPVANWSSVLSNAVSVNGDNPEFTILTEMSYNISNDTGVAYEATEYTLEIITRAFVALNCTGTNLTTQVCQDFCQNNLEVCYSDYVSYCFPDNIGKEITCRNYFGQYIEKNGPSEAIGSKLSTYCSTYKGFADLFNADSKVKTQRQRLIDSQLCACNMSDAAYAAFSKELTEKYPGYGNLGIVNKCMVPQCASSSFPSVPIPKGGCKVPNCINISVFDNNGTFDDSTVVLNQNSNCADITGNKGPIPPSPNDNYLYLILFAIIVIIIIVLIFMKIG